MYEKVGTVSFGGDSSLTGETETYVACRRAENENRESRDRGQDVGQVRRGREREGVTYSA